MVLSLTQKEEPWLNIFVLAKHYASSKDIKHIPISLNISVDDTQTNVRDIRQI